MRGKITKRAVDALTIRDARHDREVLWDTEISGFGVIAFPTGKKVYVVQYRKDGRSRRLTLGEHGRMTPDDARSQARIKLGAVESGADPIAERNRARAVRTFKEVAEDFLGHVQRMKKPRTAEEYRRLLQNHVYPAIGSTRIVEVTAADVAKLHKKMGATPINANRALAVISSVWSWAAKPARGQEVSASANPAKEIERNPEESRERYLKGDELARLGDALREAETIGLEGRGPKQHRRTRIDPHAAAAILLLILTGARLREILGLEWSQIDPERGVAFLPTSKTGKKTLYFSAAALAVLAEIPRVEGGAFVIAGEKGARRADLKRPWASVAKGAGLDGVRIHDLRHSFASVGAGASMGLPIIGKLLGHSQAATTARYAHLDADPMRRAADAIGATIAAAMEREPTGEGASNVVSIGRRS
jgi:integrase